MKKYIIVVEWVVDDYLWSVDDEMSWKNYVCQDLDENAVIIQGNENMLSDASWWKDANFLAQSIEDALGYDDVDNEAQAREAFLLDVKAEYARDKAIDVWELYQNSKYDYDDPEFLMKVAMIVSPSLKLKTKEIHGNYQGAWATAVYDTKYVDPTSLDDWYFGSVYQLTVYTLDPDDFDEDIDLEDPVVVSEEGTQDFTDFMGEHEYDEMRYGDNFTYELAQRLGVPEDQMIVIEK